jgi:hypothetical protein
MSRPRPKINPRDLMERALQLIENELDEIKAASANGKLDPDHTTALVRYSDSLLKYVKDGIEQEEEEKKKLSKMSDEELTQLATDLAAKAKKV